MKYHTQNFTQQNRVANSWYYRAVGVAMRSNTHGALFKPGTLELRAANSTVKQPACNLPHAHYNLNTLITECPPCLLIP